MSEERERLVTREEMETFDALTVAMSACLAGHGARVQGAVLADLTAMWLAGHILVGKGDGDERGAETAMREDLLKLHVETIRQLIPVNALKMKLKP